MVTFTEEIRNGKLYFLYNTSYLMPFCIKHSLAKNYTVKPRNSGHLRVLKYFSVIERCPLLGGNLTKIVTFATKRFVRYPRHVRCLGYPPLGGFTLHYFLRIGTTNRYTILIKKRLQRKCFYLKFVKF